MGIWSWIERRKRRRQCAYMGHRPYWDFGWQGMRRCRCGEISHAAMTSVGLRGATGVAHAFPDECRPAGTVPPMIGGDDISLCPVCWPDPTLFVGKGQAMVYVTPVSAEVTT